MLSSESQSTIESVAPLVSRPHRAGKEPYEEESLVVVSSNSTRSAPIKVQGRLLLRDDDCRLLSNHRRRGFLTFQRVKAKGHPTPWERSLVRNSAWWPMRWFLRCPVMTMRSTMCIGLELIGVTSKAFLLKLFPCQTRAAPTVTMRWRTSRARSLRLTCTSIKIYFESLVMSIAGSLENTIELISLRKGVFWWTSAPWLRELASLFTPGSESS